MSFPRYPKYKESGVEWLGQVPEHWEVWKLSHAFDQIGSGTTPKTDNTEYYEGGNIPWVNTGDLNDGVLEDCEKRITPQAVAENSSLKTYPSGSILIAMYGATIGKLGILNFPATVNQACCVFAGKSAVVSKFFFYCLQGFRKQIISLATGGGQPNISQEILRSLRVSCPEKNEQIAIASFLDRETAKIDALVAEQKRLIELLKEKRQAVISHAVTKGLNPNAKMKPSGIEWLGDVPEHWEIRPLKYIIKLKSGGTPSKENYSYWDGFIPWASSKDLKFEELYDTKDHITQKALDDGISELVKKDSILTVVRGMILIHTFPVVINRVPMAINQDLKAIAPNPKINTDYLASLLRGASTEILSRTDEAAHGTKVLRVETWLSMQVPVPSINEQTAIAAKLQELTADFDQLTAEAQRAIDLLQERRSALISAAVTGQINVRGLVPSEAA
jgi:type I restriction enzyme S subunit